MYSSSVPRWGRVSDACPREGQKRCVFACARSERFLVIILRFPRFHLSRPRLPPCLFFTSSWAETNSPFSSSPRWTLASRCTKAPTVPDSSSTPCFPIHQAEAHRAFITAATFSYNIPAESHCPSPDFNATVHTRKIYSGIISSSGGGKKRALGDLEGQSYCNPLTSAPPLLPPVLPSQQLID